MATKQTKRSSIGRRIFQAYLNIEELVSFFHKRRDSNLMVQETEETSSLGIKTGYAFIFDERSVLYNKSAFFFCITRFFVSFFVSTVVPLVCVLYTSK